ncbi:MAG: hypothetical protein WD030_02460 [Pirellulales bacterium]
MSDYLFDTSRYPTGLGSLIPECDACPIGPGHANGEVLAALEALDLDQAFMPRRIVDRDMLRACHAGLWLIHNFLDESHHISQDLKNPTGSFWHAIMHRREGDFSNAKYWFRQTGEHPVLKELGSDVVEIVGEAPSERSSLLDDSGSLDPFALVDWCSAATRGDDTQQQALCRLTRREWERLFDWCFRQATADSFNP